MATPYKTKSGKWAIRVYSHTDQNKKPHQKRFTADTKKEVLAMAREFEFDRGRVANGEMTVAECVRQYIDKRKLSPTTLNGYESIYRVEFNDGDVTYWREKLARDKRNVRIGSIRITSLTADKVQEWLDDLAGIVSAKRVHNIYGLLTAALRDAGIQIDVDLPRREKAEIRVPTSAEVKHLLELAEGTPLHLAIELAAFASLRAGEVSALRRSDLQDGKITVRRSMACAGRGNELKWVTKEPKTASSRRVIPVPGFLAEEILKGGERVVDMNPAQISNAYIKLVNRSGLEHTRFHDLRHFFASYYHAAAVPDAYLMEWGGWSNDGTLQKIYRNTLADERQRIAERMNVLLTDAFCG